MAVLEKIRNNAGLVVGVVGLGLFAFVIGDAIQSSTSIFGQNDLTVLKVGDKEVQYHEYERRLQTMQDLQGGQLTDEQRMMLNNQLAQSFIADYATEELAKQVGIKVTGEEVYALLHGEGITPSRSATQFFASFGVDIHNSEAVNTFIQQMSDKSISALPAEQQVQMRALQAQWQSVQRGIERERMQEKLAALLSRSYRITKLDEELANQGGARTVRFVRSVAPAISDETQKATAEEIKAYYDKHKEAYRMPAPMTALSYISMEVTPSPEDYQAADAEATKAQLELAEATGIDDIERIARGYSGSIVPATYLTGSELDRLQLGANELNFIKTASAGEVFSDGLVDDRHSIIKLIDKKQGLESLQVRIAILDSTMSKQADSLKLALSSKESFEAFAKEHSLDKQSGANGGLLEFPNELGMSDAKLTEAMASQIGQQVLGFDKVFTSPVGSVLVLGTLEARILVRTESPGAMVEKYRFAIVSIPAEFSSKTYDGYLAKLNQILGEGGSFDDMATKAEKEGFIIERNEFVGASSAMVGRIPSSRSLVQWALNAKAGETTDKVHRLGQSYLAIATVTAHHKQGYAPLSLVEESIKAAVESEKRAKALVDKLTAKGFTTLEEYATELGVEPESLVGVTYQVRGREGAAFNATAMTTALGSLSKPFDSGSEVFVVSPQSLDETTPEQLSSQSRQQERNVGYQIFSRAFDSFIQKLKVDDKRGKFF